jgi:hypothetical protein
MSTATIVTPKAFHETEALANSGKTIDAWKNLAAHGDQYANAAVHVLSFQWSMLNCVRAAHWNLTVPQHPIGGEVWNDIASHALRNYLSFVEKNRASHEQELGEKLSDHHPMPLPNTKQIEASYMAAVAEVNVRKGANVNPRCIIHLAGNRFTTPPNKIVERIVHAVAPWVGPWKRVFRNFTMPDWEKVACRDFGDLGARMRHDSDQMSPDNYVSNAFVLGRAFVTGMAKYYRGVYNARSRQIAPGVTSAPGGVN